MHEEIIRGDHEVYWGIIFYLMKTIQENYHLNVDINSDSIERCSSSDNNNKYYNNNSTNK